MKNLQHVFLIVILTLFCLVESSFADPTEFTYQGELLENGTPANGFYNFEFRLFDAPNGTGVEMSPPVELSSVPVVDGVFTVQLNFGDVWNGADKYLQIAVAKPSDVDFTLLIPKQKINNTPMAIYALNAASFDGITSDGFIKNSVNEQAGANFNISGTGRANLLTAQAIGVGTTSPGAKLTVSRPTQSASHQLEIRNEGNITKPNFDGIVFTQGAAGGTELGSIKLKYRNTGRPDLSLSVRERPDALYIHGNESGRGGNVGIGTIVPRSPLHVSSDSDPSILVTAKSTNGQDSGIAIIGARNASTSADAAYIDLRDFDEDEDTGTEFSMARIAAGMADVSGQTGNLRFYTNDGSGLNEHMRITKNGKVGLGTSLPTADLHLYSIGSLNLRMTADADNSGESDQPSITMVQDGGFITGSIGFFDANNDLSIRANDKAGGLADILLEPEGRVGIGTNDPQNMLDVRGPGTFVGGRGQPVGTTNLADTVVARFLQTTSGVGSAISIDSLSNDSASHVYWAHNGLAAFAIQSFQGRLNFFKANNGVIQDKVMFIGTGDGIFLGLMPGQQQEYDLGSDARSWKNITTFGLVNKSDIRLKQEIRDLDYGITDVMKLRPVRFKWKKRPEEGDHLGIIAQDVERVIPEIVSPASNKGVTRSVSYISLIPVLINGMQDQQHEIESITEQNRFLQQRIEDLEAVVDNLVAASSPGRNRNQ